MKTFFIIIVFSVLSLVIGWGWLQTLRNLSGVMVPAIMLAVIPLFIGAIVGAIVAFVSRANRLAGIVIGSAYLAIGVFLVANSYIDQRLKPECIKQASDSFKESLEVSHLSAWCIGDRQLKHLLNRAERENSLAVFERLIDFGVPHPNANCVRLYLAVKKGDSSAVTRLLQQGTSPNCNSEGRTPIGIWYYKANSSKDVQRDILNQLLDAGGEIGAEHLRIAIRQQDPLKIATAIKRADANAGVDQATMDNSKFIKHPLALAIRMNDAKTFRLLIDAGADPSIDVFLSPYPNSKTYRELSLLEYAHERYSDIEKRLPENADTVAGAGKLQPVREIIALLEELTPEDSKTPIAIADNEPEATLSATAEEPDEPARATASESSQVTPKLEADSGDTINVLKLAQYLPSFSSLRGFLKTYSSRINSLIAASPQLPIFLSGPYPEGILNREQTGHFGHYNPAFLRWSIDEVLVKNDFSDAYNNRTRPWIRLLHQQGSYLKRHPVLLSEYVTDYQQALSTGEGLKGYYLRNYREMYGQRQAYAIAFWVRRHVDGTAPLFDEIFEHLLTRYDNDYWLSLQQPPDTAAVDEPVARASAPAAKTECTVTAEYEGAIPERLFGFLRIDENDPQLASVYTSNQRYNRFPQGEIPCVANRNIWIFNEGRILPGKILSANINRSVVGALKLSIQVETPLQAGIVKSEPFRRRSYVYLDKNPVPKQTWSSSKILYGTHKQAIKDHARLLGIQERLRSVRSVVIRTGDRREYLLINYTEHHDEPTNCKNTYNCVITLLLRLNNQGAWEIEQEFRTANHGRPYVDANGDGVPEFIGISGYKSERLTSIIKSVDDLPGFGLLIDSGL